MAKSTGRDRKRLLYHEEDKNKGQDQSYSYYHYSSLPQISEIFWLTHLCLKGFVLNFTVTEGNDSCNLLHQTVADQVQQFVLDCCVSFDVKETSVLNHTKKTKTEGISFQLSSAAVGE